MAVGAVSLSKTTSLWYCAPTPLESHVLSEEM